MTHQECCLARRMGEDSVAEAKSIRGTDFRGISNVYTVVGTFVRENFFSESRELFAVRWSVGKFDSATLSFTYIYHAIQSLCLIIRHTTLLCRKSCPLESSSPLARHSPTLHLTLHRTIQPFLSTLRPMVLLVPSVLCSRQ
jgi:hypothetical protein